MFSYRRLATLSVAIVGIAATESGSSTGPTQTDYRERVRVERILIDARAIDRHGRAIPGLGAEDFRVRVGGKEARIVEATWFPLSDEPSIAVQSRTPNADPDGEPTVPDGRTFVVLFHRDLDPSRAPGLMMMLRRLEEFLDTFGPRDRVAVLVFGSHLELKVDFTNDVDAVQAIVRHAILPDRSATRPPADGVQLAQLLSESDLRDVSSPEAALLAIGEALRELPGPKTMLYVGWGMGVYGATGVRLRHEYAPAVRALVASRTTVFTLDVTEADYHSLQGPLIKLAQDTGGFYIKTMYSSYFAMDLVEGMLGGRYELVCELPRLEQGRHDLRVQLSGIRGQVLHREALELLEPVNAGE